MITRLTYLLLPAFYLASCKVEKKLNHDNKKSEIKQSVESVSDFLSQNQLRSEMVFSEHDLNSWGYITVEVADKYHAIRSKMNYGDASEALYARFHLAKIKFDNRADASTIKNRLVSLLKTEAGFKDYTQIIQKDDTLYSVSATSNYTFLEHQSKLMDTIRTNLTSKAKQ